MSINAWFNPKTNTYHIKYDGRDYTRKSYTAAKELIDSLLPNMVLQTIHDTGANRAAI